MTKSKALKLLLNATFKVDYDDNPKRDLLEFEVTDISELTIKPELRMDGDLITLNQAAASWLRPEAANIYSSAQIASLSAWFVRNIHDGDKWDGDKKRWRDEFPYVLLNHVMWLGKYKALGEDTVPVVFNETEDIRKACSRLQVIIDEKIAVLETETLSEAVRTITQASKNIVKAVSDDANDRDREEDIR